MTFYFKILIIYNELLKDHSQKDVQELMVKCLNLRRFSRKKCIQGPVRGFSKEIFKFHLNFVKNPRRNNFCLTTYPSHAKSFELPLDKNPSDQVPIKYTTIDDVKKEQSKSWNNAKSVPFTREYADGYDYESAIRSNVKHIIYLKFPMPKK